MTITSFHSLLTGTVTVCSYVELAYYTSVNRGYRPPKPNSKHLIFFPLNRKVSRVLAYGKVFHETGKTNQMRSK